MKLQALLALLLFSFASKSQVPEQDCVNALPVCFDAPIHISKIYEGEGFIPDEINPQINCLADGESNIVWFKVKATSAGNLGFTITPDGEFDDIDWAVYNLTNANCTDIFNNVTLNVSCNFDASTFPSAATGPNGGSFPQDEPVIPALAGETYYIAVSSYLTPLKTFSINFNQTTFDVNNRFDAGFSDTIMPMYFPPQLLGVTFNDNIICNSVHPSDFTLVNTDNGFEHDITYTDPVYCTGPNDTCAHYFMLSISPELIPNTTYKLKRIGWISNLCGAIFSQPDSTIFTAEITGAEEYTEPAYTTNTIATNKVMVSAPTPLSGSFNIYNLSGMLMQTQRVENTNSVELSMDGYTQGLYILTFTNTQGQTYSTKIVKVDN
jgi:hypothetical protein